MRNDKRILWVVMWIVVAATIAVAGIGAWRIGPRWLLADLPTPTTEALAPIQPSTLILDRQGQVLYEVIPETGKQTPLSIDEIPAACWQATVAVEDSRFFEHPGFDPLAILRAAWQNWRNGAIVSGASMSALKQEHPPRTRRPSDGCFPASHTRSPAGPI